MANMFSETCLCYDIESETGVYTTCYECDPPENDVNGDITKDKGRNND